MRASDSHLRDVSAVKGHHIQAADGEIGHVEDFLIDDRTWSVRYLIVDTSNWLGGRRVLIAPSWIEVVSWAEARVQLRMTRQAVENSPEYDESAEVERTYEQRLYAHYDQTGYWGDRRDEGAPDSRFARLDELIDIEVAKGDPDVRGWSVVGSDGQDVGTVEHLVVDRQAMTVRYLEVSLDRAGTGDGGSHKVLISIEDVDLDDGKEGVRLASLPSARVSALPAFLGFPINDAYEQRLRQELSTGEPVRRARAPGPRTRGNSDARRF